MNCVELQESLAEVEDANSLEQRAHLRACPACTALVRELDLIIAAAGELQAAGWQLERVLSDNGRADLCYTIASQKDYPSWGYMVEQGATTIWELWNGNTADPTMNSGNHVMLIGDLVVWFYEYLAGIAPDDAQPGFKHIIMRPTPVGDLTFVKATHNSPYGLISSEWHRDGNKFDWQIEIPANTTAMVYIPMMPKGRVTESGKPVDVTKGFKSGLGLSSVLVRELGSGKYHFVSE